MPNKPHNPQHPQNPAPIPVTRTVNAFGGKLHITLDYRDAQRHHVVDNHSVHCRLLHARVYTASTYTYATGTVHHDPLSINGLVCYAESTYIREHNQIGWFTTYFEGLRRVEQFGARVSEKANQKFQEFVKGYLTASITPADEVMIDIRSRELEAYRYREHVSALVAQMYKANEAIEAERIAIEMLLEGSLPPGTYTPGTQYEKR